MLTSLSLPADVVNAALVELGHTDRIGDLSDGTEISGAALSVYGQTRDDLLREFDPGFAQKSATLALLKRAPAGGYIPGVSDWNPTTNPPVQWLYEYGYPADCLRVRAVIPPRIFVPNFSPQPVAFREFDDDYLTPPAKVIGCNTANAMIVYTARVTNVTLWEATFTQTLIERLAKAMAPAVAKITNSGFAAERTAMAGADKSELTDVSWQG